MVYESSDRFYPLNYSLTDAALGLVSVNRVAGKSSILPPSIYLIDFDRGSKF